jgi:hypothetical protein
VVQQRDQREQTGAEHVGGDAHPSLPEPVDQRSADRLGQHVRAELGRHHQAGLDGGPAGGEHEPGDGDGRDPEADRGDADRAEEPDDRASRGHRGSSGTASESASALAAGAMGTIWNRVLTGQVPGRGPRSASSWG